MMSTDLDYGERWPSDDWWLPLPDDDQDGCVGTEQPLVSGEQ